MSTRNDDKLLIVYKNIFNLLNYRGYKNISNAQDDGAFLNSIQTSGHVQITASQQSGSTVATYMFVPLLSFSKGDMVKFLKTRASADIERIIIVVENKDPETRRAADARQEKKRRDLSTRNEKLRDAMYRYILSPSFGELINSKAYIEIIDYATLAFNMPQHVQFTKYSTKPPDVVQQMTDFHFRDPSKFNPILATDPSLVWCDARVGDIVFGEIKSESAGIGFVVRRVLAPKMQFNAGDDAGDESDED